MASDPKAADRLRENVLGESFDWAYVECNLDPGEPDLRDDVAAVLQRLEELEADSSNYRAKCDKCGTANMDMLTDDHCTECTFISTECDFAKYEHKSRERIAELEAEVSQLECNVYQNVKLRTEVAKLEAALRRCAVFTGKATGDDETDNESLNESASTELLDVPDLVSDRVSALECRIAEMEAENQRLLKQLPPDVLLRKVIARKEVD